MFLVSYPFNRVMTSPFNAVFGGVTVLNPALYWGGNLIRGYPDPALADGSQPIWWNITNDETLTEEDATGESIAMPNERVLKLVISADGGGADYAYQDFDAADEPTLVDNDTVVSAGIWVYQKSTDTAGTITLELYDVDGTASLGTATTTTQDSAVLLKIENVTYQDSMRYRLTHSANSAIVYAANPMLNIGPTLRPWSPRTVEYVSTYSAEVLNEAPADANWADVDFSGVTEANCMMLHVYHMLSRLTSQARSYLRPNGSSEGQNEATMVHQSATGIDSGHTIVLCDAGQVIEESVQLETRVAAIILSLVGYWRWN